VLSHYFFSFSEAFYHTGKFEFSNQLKILYFYNYTTCNFQENYFLCKNRFSQKTASRKKTLLAKKPPKTTNIEFSETVLDKFSLLKNTLCVTVYNRCIPLGIDTETDTVTGMDTVTEMDIDMNVNCK
jgi:hypothetical protein